MLSKCFFSGILMDTWLLVHELHLVSVYMCVCQDHDRRVREATQQAFEQLVLKVRRSLAPFLKSLMGHWMLAQCDTYTPAASAACQVFHAAFPPGKQPEALSFCREEILNVSKSGGTEEDNICIHSSYNHETPGKARKCSNYITKCW